MIEADGVYFRILEMDTPLKTYNRRYYFGISKDMLYKYSWILNTLKFWFVYSSLVLKENHTLVEEIGTTYTLDTLKDMDVSSLIHILTELCVFNNVSLKFLKKFMLENPHLKIYNVCVRALNKYSNAPIIIF